MKYIRKREIRGKRKRGVKEVRLRSERNLSRAKGTPKEASQVRQWGQRVKKDHEKNIKPTR